MEQNMDSGFEQYKDLLDTWISRDPKKRRLEYSEEPCSSGFIKIALIAYNEHGVSVKATDGVKSGTNTDSIKFYLMRKIALTLNLA